MFIDMSACNSDLNLSIRRRKSKGQSVLAPSKQVSSKLVKIDKDENEYCEIVDVENFPSNPPEVSLSALDLLNIQTETDAISKVFESLPASFPFENELGISPLASQSRFRVTNIENHAHHRNSFSYSDSDQEVSEDDDCSSSSCNKFTLRNNRHNIDISNLDRVLKKTLVISCEKLNIDEYCKKNHYIKTDWDTVVLKSVDVENEKPMKKSEIVNAAKPAVFDSLAPDHKTETKYTSQPYNAPNIVFARKGPVLVQNIISSYIKSVNDKFKSVESETLSERTYANKLNFKNFTQEGKRSAEITSRSATSETRTYRPHKVMLSTIVKPNDSLQNILDVDPSSSSTLAVNSAVPNGNRTFVDLENKIVESDQFVSNETVVQEKCKRDDFFAADLQNSSSDNLDNCFSEIKIRTEPEYIEDLTCELAHSRGKESPSNSAGSKLAIQARENNFGTNFTSDIMVQRNSAPRCSGSDICEPITIDDDDDVDVVAIDSQLRTIDIKKEMEIVMLEAKPKKLSNSFPPARKSTSHCAKMIKTDRSTGVNNRKPFGWNVQSPNIPNIGTDLGFECSRYNAELDDLLFGSGYSDLDFLDASENASVEIVHIKQEPDLEDEEKTDATTEKLNDLSKSSPLSSCESSPSKKQNKQVKKNILGNKSDSPKAVKNSAFVSSKNVKTPVSISPKKVKIPVSPNKSISPTKVKIPVSVSPKKLKKTVFVSPKKISNSSVSQKTNSISQKKITVKITRKVKRNKSDIQDDINDIWTSETSIEDNFKSSRCEKGKISSLASENDTKFSRLSESHRRGSVTSKNRDKSDKFKAISDLDKSGVSSSESSQEDASISKLSKGNSDLKESKSTSKAHSKKYSKVKNVSSVVENPVAMNDNDLSSNFASGCGVSGNEGHTVKTVPKSKNKDISSKSSRNSRHLNSHRHRTSAKLKEKPVGEKHNPSFKRSSAIHARVKFKEEPISDEDCPTLQNVSVESDIVLSYQRDIESEMDTSKSEGNISLDSASSSSCGIKEKCSIPNENVVPDCNISISDERTQNPEKVNEHLKSQSHVLTTDDKSTKEGFNEDTKVVSVGDSNSNEACTTNEVLGDQLVRPTGSPRHILSIFEEELNPNIVEEGEENRGKVENECNSKDETDAKGQTVDANSELCIENVESPNMPEEAHADSDAVSESSLVICDSVDGDENSSPDDFTILDSASDDDGDCVDNSQMEVVDSVNVVDSEKIPVVGYTENHKGSKGAQTTKDKASSGSPLTKKFESVDDEVSVEHKHSDELDSGIITEDKSLQESSVCEEQNKDETVESAISKNESEVTCNTEKNESFSSSVMNTVVPEEKDSKGVDIISDSEPKISDTEIKTVRDVLAETCEQVRGIIDNARVSSTQKDVELSSVEIESPCVSEGKLEQPSGSVSGGDDLDKSCNSDATTHIGEKKLEQPSDNLIDNKDSIPGAIGAALDSALDSSDKSDVSSGNSGLRATIKNDASSNNEDVPDSNFKKTKRKSSDKTDEDVQDNNFKKSKRKSSDKNESSQIKEKHSSNARSVGRRRSLKVSEPPVTTDDQDAKLDVSGDAGVTSTEFSSHDKDVAKVPVLQQKTPRTKVAKQVYSPDDNSSPGFLTPCSKRGAKKKTNYSLEDVVVPFKRGWMREVVHRATLTKNLQRLVDIYYFTPEGTKLRSMPEVLKYLSEHKDCGLTVQNFTFAKECIYRHPFEKERGARGKPGEGTESSPLKSEHVDVKPVKKVSLTPFKRKLEAKNVESVPAKKIKLEPVVNDNLIAKGDDSSVNCDKKPSRTARKSFPKFVEKTVPVKSANDKSSAKISCTERTSNKVEVICEKPKKYDKLADAKKTPAEIEPKPSCNVVPTPKPASKKPVKTSPKNIVQKPGDSSFTNREKRKRQLSLKLIESKEQPSEQPPKKNTKFQITISKVAKQIEPFSIPSRRCSNQCAVAAIQKPTIQCSGCLCLFHAYCVPLKASSTTFLCKPCTEIATSKRQPNTSAGGSISFNEPIQSVGEFLDTMGPLPSFPEVSLELWPSSTDPPESPSSPDASKVEEYLFRLPPLPPLKRAPERLITKHMVVSVADESLAGGVGPLDATSRMPFNMNPVGAVGPVNISSASLGPTAIIGPVNVSPFPPDKTPVGAVGPVNIISSMPLDLSASQPVTTSLSATAASSSQSARGWPSPLVSISNMTQRMRFLVPAGTLGLSGNMVRVPGPNVTFLRPILPSESRMSDPATILVPISALPGVPCSSSNSASTLSSLQTPSPRPQSPLVFPDAVSSSQIVNPLPGSANPNVKSIITVSSIRNVHPPGAAFPPTAAASLEDAGKTGNTNVTPYRIFLPQQRHVPASDIATPMNQNKGNLPHSMNKQVFAAVMRGGNVHQVMSGTTFVSRTGQLMFRSRGPPGNIKAVAPTLQNLNEGPRVKIVQVTEPVVTSTTATTTTTTVSKQGVGMERSQSSDVSYSPSSSDSLSDSASVSSESSSSFQNSKAQNRKIKRKKPSGERDSAKVPSEDLKAKSQPKEHKNKKKRTKSNEDNNYKDDKEMSAGNVEVNGDMLLPARNVTKFLVNPNMNTLTMGYDCLNLIFQKLSVGDLVRASQVCRSWRNLASQNFLWENVSLQNLHVSDWRQCTAAFRKFGTKILNLRGVLRNEDNGSWKEFNQSLRNLSGIEHLTFGQVPPFILEAVADGLPLLERLECYCLTTTEKKPEMWTTTCELRFFNLRFLKRLKKLKIRSAGGILSDEAPMELKFLNDLEHLSLTSLKDFPGTYFSFLSHMQNLISLELGDCCLWGKENYEALGNLTKLTQLRLENGGGFNIGLAEALMKLEKLKDLELMRYRIPSDLGDALENLADLIKLSLWPDMSVDAPRINYNAFKTAEKVKQTSYFCWGIISPDECVPLLPIFKDSSDAENGEDKTGYAYEDLYYEDLFDRLCDVMPNAKIDIKCISQDFLNEYCCIQR